MRAPEGGLRSGAPRSAARVDLLVFLEDPGAANFVLDFPAAFSRRGLRCRLAASGPAREFLGQREVDFLPLDGRDSAIAALESLAPRAVALGTADRPDALNHFLAHECRSRGIPAAGFLDGYGNLEKRFGDWNGNPLAHAPDWILTADAPSRAGYLGFGCDPARVLDLGHPGLEKVAAEKDRLDGTDRAALRRRLFPAARSDAAVVVFAAELSRTGVPGQYRRDSGYTLTGSGRFQGRGEIVLEEVLDALEPFRDGRASAPFTVLRLHPKNTREEFAPFLDRIDQVSQGGSPLELAYAADAVIGVTTLLLLEAAYLGKPVLSVVPKEEETEWLWTIRTGHTPCARTREDVRRETASLLARAASPQAELAGRELPDPRGALERYVGFFEALMEGSGQG